MKKALFLAFILIFGVASIAMAQGYGLQSNTANVSQPGSVLIFPKIDVSGGFDTVITISNIAASGVTLHCFYMDSAQFVTDFSIPLTANQPVAFSAGKTTGGQALAAPPGFTTPPFVSGPIKMMKGELICVAVDADGSDRAISWNYLTGSAKVIDFTSLTAYEYNAWSFQHIGRVGNLLTALVPDGTVDYSSGVVKLDGNKYSACPEYFLGNFFATGSGNNGLILDTDLTLVPCKQDVRELNRQAIWTNAQFYMWNADESPYSGTDICLKCWYEDVLSDISSQFDYSVLQTSVARFRVNGVAVATCGTATDPSVNTPFVGLLVEKLDFGGASPIIKTASTGFGAGEDDSGSIIWTPIPPTTK
jgi:hypothetical protein